MQSVEFGFAVSPLENMQHSRVEIFCVRGLLLTYLGGNFILSELNHSLFVVCCFICVIIDLQKWQRMTRSRLQTVWKMLGQPLQTSGESL